MPNLFAVIVELGFCSKSNCSNVPCKQMIGVPLLGLELAERKSYTFAFLRLLCVSTKVMTKYEKII